MSLLMHVCVTIRMYCSTCMTGGGGVHVTSELHLCPGTKVMRLLLMLNLSFKR